MIGWKGNLLINFCISQLLFLYFTLFLVEICISDEEATWEQVAVLKQLEVLFSLRFSICISPSWVFVFHPFRNLYFWRESKVGTGGRWWSGGSWQAWEWEGLLSLPLMLKPLDCDGDYSGDDDNWGGDDDTFTGRRRGGLVSPVGTHSLSVQCPPYQQFSSILKNSLCCLLS